jgi:hypothetical protein
MKLGNWTLAAALNRVDCSTTLATVAALFCICSSISAAEVYTWTDQNGITHFSQVPPDTGSSELIDVEDAYRPGTTGAYPESEETDPALSADTADLFTESVDNIASSAGSKLPVTGKHGRKKKLKTPNYVRKTRTCWRAWSLPAG